MLPILHEKFFFVNTKIGEIKIFPIPEQDSSGFAVAAPYNVDKTAGRADSRRDAARKEERVWN